MDTESIDERNEVAREGSAADLKLEKELDGFANRPDWVQDKAPVEKEAGGTDSEMAVRLRELKDQKDTLESALKKTNSAIDALSTKLAESMESHGVDSFKVKGVGSVYIQEVNRPHVADADAFIAFLDETGQGSMAPRSVHWKRLESWVKEMLKQGTSLPASVTNFQQKRALIRRS